MTQDADELAPLLGFLKHARGFDFSGYKRPSLERRFRKRMEEVGVATYGEYLDLLQAQPDELTQLFDRLLVNVTSFFRDPGAWRTLDEDVLPQLLQTVTDRELRVWSAGCASGEEAYTIAMLLARRLGDRAFRERVKIYATDADEDALSVARVGTYADKQVETIPDALRERCFEPADGGHTFRKDLRRSVIFGRNDLVLDAPISRIDLLLCRNVLIYLNAETQARVLARLHFGLADHGFLVLGKSELLLTHGDLFRPVDLDGRIFAKVARGPVRDRPAFVTQSPDEPAADRAYAQVREGALDLAPVAQLVVDRADVVVHVNGRARALFGLSPRDLGRPLQDLEVSYRPVELRSAIEQSYAERRTIVLPSVRWEAGHDDERRLDVAVAPVPGDADEALGASITLDDVTDHTRLREELERSKREIEVAYEELQSTVEELETTNEELQSTNEELETTNEELQSTNEELETMNEELQSTIEELETMNDELGDRSLELNDVNAFLEAILTSLGSGVVVVDGEQRIQIWNRGAEDLWGVRGEEARGEHLLALDIGLPVDRLKAALRAALSGDVGDGTVLLPATNRRGRRIECAVTCAPLTGVDGEVRGAVLLMEQRTEV